MRDICRHNHHLSRPRSYCITDAGNAASVTDAKSIAGSAIVGLLLALLSFVILKTINPDVLYLKKPGSGFEPIPSTNLASCGSWNSVAGVCTCRNGDTPAAANAVACGTTCETTPERCQAPPMNVCLDPNFPSEPTDKECHCLNGYTYDRSAFSSCQALCSDPANNVSPNPTCIRVDVKGTVNDHIDVQFIDSKTIKAETVPVNTITVFDNISFKVSVKDPKNLLVSDYRYNYILENCTDDNEGNPSPYFVFESGISELLDKTHSVELNLVTPPGSDHALDCWASISITDSNALTVYAGFIRMKIDPAGFWGICAEDADCKSGRCNLVERNCYLL